MKQVTYINGAEVIVEESRNGHRQVTINFTQSKKNRDVKLVIAEPDSNERSGRVCVENTGELLRTRAVQPSARLVSNDFFI